MSPCIKLCKLNKDNICIGCYRSLKEITQWSKLSLEEQKQIVHNAKKRKL